MGLMILRKVHEDADFLYISSIRLPSGQEFIIEDKDGAPVHKVDTSGNVKSRGKQMKLT